MHFLAVRKQEAIAVETTNISDLLGELETTYAKYHDSISILPNPDAIVAGGNMTICGHFFEASVRAAVA